MDTEVDIIEAEETATEQETTVETIKQPPDVRNAEDRVEEDTEVEQPPAVEEEENEEGTREDVKENTALAERDRQPPKPPPRKGRARIKPVWHDSYHVNQQ